MAGSTGAGRTSAGRTGDWLERHWRAVLLIAWIGAAAFMLYDRWTGIAWFALPDTDDNLRIAQVRALLAGQDWFDLRQYRLAPPGGADIHWSRLVDLPIAGIKLLLSPLIGGAMAERAAVAIAPLLPMGVAMGAVAVTARRLVGPKAYLLALPILFTAGSARAMWSPLRIDHHGWQLALLALVLTALTDRRGGRGGVLLGLSMALSLAIGLELLLYLALAGGLTVLMWIRDPLEARRLAAFGASLAGGCALAFLLLASNANRFPVCDALSPVWLSAMAAAGALAVGLATAPLAGWRLRFAAAALGGALLAAGFALIWPDCLGRLEQVSPELERLWLGKVREAMPIYRHSPATIVAVATLPLLGLVGTGLMLRRCRRDFERLNGWAAAGALALLAASLLLWQTRAAPAAQLLAVPGATALGWLLIMWFRSRESMALRIAGTAGVILILTGVVTDRIIAAFPETKSAGRREVDLANRRCPTLPALRAVALQPPGTVLTFVDLGPRLIAVTPHNAITGPYHRNQRQIIDVMQAWRGDAANARRIVERYRADYLLICPNMSESTVYRAEAPRGFYMQLVRDQVPAWLEPIALPEGSPYRMWRVVR